MSHLSHEVCGVDFFISYNNSSLIVSKLIEHMQIFFKNNHLTYYLNDSIQFNQNYMQANQLQAIRSKIFLFFIDKFALECDWFLSYFVYAKEYSSAHHLPIMLPILFDREFDLYYDEDENLKIKDKLVKDKVINELIKDCAYVIRMSKLNTFEEFIRHLKEAIYEVIPLNQTEYRFIDNYRPMIQKEEEFFKGMKLKEVELAKKLPITRYNFKSILPSEKIYIALSVPYDELDYHLKKMIYSQCHLIWVDSISINKVNYFNLLWQINENEANVAKPPSYLIFYDLNTAQLAQLYHEYSIDKHWNLELVESYIKLKKSGLKNESKVKFKKKRSSDCKSAKKAEKTVEPANPALVESNEEIVYICQFKQQLDKNESVNKLQHSLIDTKFNDAFDQCVKYNPHKKSISIPLRICPLVVNVNTLTNKHYYYTCLYKPIEKFKYDSDTYFSEHTDHLKQSPLYYSEKNLTDTELVKLYESNSKNNWKLIDLKAYKDEKSITKFSTVWSSLNEQVTYEGTFKLFVGLTKDEALNKINEMNSKGMWAKLVTSYSYLNSSGDHVYAIFFCQF